MAIKYWKGIRHLVIFFLCLLAPLCLLFLQFSPDQSEKNTVTLTKAVYWAEWSKNKSTRPNLLRTYNIKHGRLSSQQFKSPMRSNSSGPNHVMPRSRPMLSSINKIMSDRHVEYDDWLRTGTHQSRDYVKRPNHKITATSVTVPTTRPNNTNTVSATVSATNSISCKLLFELDKSEVKRAQKKMKQEHYHIQTDYEIITSTKNCKSYIASKGYITNILSPEEEQYPIAYSIRMHHKVAQAERLLRTVYRPQNVYCIYIDKKAPQSIHKAMKGIADCFPNVFLASNTSDYVYTSFSPVEADLQCMKELLRTNINWKYYLNLAGTEFPIKTNLEIVRILKLLNGTNDIEQYPYPKFYYARIKFKYRVENNQLVNTTIPKEPFPNEANVTITKGCSYNSFTRPFVEWVLTDNLAQKVIHWSRDIHSPDEVVWATANNLPGAPGRYPGMITQTAKTFLSRAIKWSTGISYCQAQHFVRGVCILSVGDLHWLRSRWEMFANKFDESYDHMALDCLDAELRNRTMHPDPDHNINWFGIYRAPHVRSTPPPHIHIR